MEKNLIIDFLKPLLTNVHFQDIPRVEAVSEAIDVDAAAAALEPTPDPAR